MRRKISTLAAVALLAGLLPLAGISAAGAQVGPATVVPIQITGEPSERLNFILMGDGYQADEMDQFHADVDRNLAVLWTLEPFHSYRSYINIYAMELPSEDSGISCDPDDGNVQRNTPLGLRYSSQCPADPLARGVTYSPEGAQRRNEYLNTYMAPILGVEGNVHNQNNVQTLAIFNSFTYGGIGGQHATTSGGSPQGPLVSSHELGHSTGNNYPDEYPYSSRDVVRPCYTGGEPSSFNHTIYTSTAQMIADQHKWWRWIGEESESGGIIGLWEGGNSRPCGIRRPSEHSMMRWIGFYFDQPGREHMVGRISGMRFANAMPLPSTPEGEVGPDDVVWVQPMRPKYHELKVTWRVNDEVVPNPGNTGFLDLGELDVSAGDTVEVTVNDPTDFVRDPALADGPRMTQTRRWTVGTPLPATPGDVAFTISTQRERPVDGDEIVYVETTYPTDRVPDVTWRLDGEVVPNPHNRRNFDIGAQQLAPGTYELSATVTDPADTDGGSETLTWTVDNIDPTAPRTLSEGLTTLDGDLEHPVYFGGWDMWLDPQDDQTGYDAELYTVGELRLNRDGWFNYFGFPEEPFGSPFRFRHSGTSVKALTYGNLGTGGLSKAAFEQYFDGHPSGTFEPGYGTHFVEHRAIDPAGNISEPEAYRATVLPGESPECTTTLSGSYNTRTRVRSGVVCLAGDAVRNGGLEVSNGASVVASDGARINGGLTATDADVVHLFGATINGGAHIAGTTTDTILVNNSINGNLLLFDNSGRDITILSGATRNYGVLLVGNDISGQALCEGNSPTVDDFDVPNTVGGSEADDICASLFGPATDELDDLAAAGGITAGLEAKLRHALDTAQAWLADPAKRGGPALSHLDRTVHLLLWQADVIETSNKPTPGDPAGLRALAATIAAIADAYRS